MTTASFSVFNSISMVYRIILIVRNRFKIPFLEVAVLLCEML